MTTQRRAEGKGVRDSFPVSGQPRQRKGEQLFLSSPTVVPKGRIRETSLGLQRRGTKLDSGRPC